MIMKRVTSVFLIASTLLLVCGALYFPWWVGELGSGTFEIDLRGMRMCVDSVCGPSKALSIADASGTAWAKIGISAFASSLVAAFLLLLVFVHLLAKGAQTMLHWLAGVMALFAGALSLVFIWLRPEFGTLIPDYGLACAFAGALVGVAAVSGAKQITARAALPDVSIDD